MCIRDRLTTFRGEFAVTQKLAQIEQLVRSEATLRLELYTSAEVLQQQAGRYLAALARGERIQKDRLRFRQQTAGQLQESRYKNMAFRIFRNEAVQKYRAMYDTAARYTYLTAKAYDFETNLLEADTKAGQHFLGDIVRARSLGQIVDGQFITGGGQPTLADAMGRMFLNFDLVLRGQLGFNNPQTETNRFSLRSELFRIHPGPQGNAQWRQLLANHVVPDILKVPEFQRYCIPPTPTELEEPGIVIPFSTTINFGQNFFSWPLSGDADVGTDWGGDSAYDSTNFATKIRSVGVWFSNYDNVGPGMSNTPRVYLIPVGNDRMRSPSGAGGALREYKIFDQALPVPFPLGPGDIGGADWIPSVDGQIGSFGAIRRYPSFRAYHDSGNFDPAETIQDSRLIGRSVWNTEWLLIIPAGTLHSDRAEGIARFIEGPEIDGARTGDGVYDISLFFQTYAYSGNTQRKANGAGLGIEDMNVEFPVVEE